MRLILLCAAALLFAGARTACSEVIALTCEITNSVGVGPLAEQKGAMHLRVDTTQPSVTITRDFPASGSPYNEERYDNSQTGLVVKKVDIRQDAMTWLSWNQNATYKATMNRTNGQLVENDSCAGCVVAQQTVITYSCAPDSL